MKKKVTEAIALASLKISFPWIACAVSCGDEAIMDMACQGLADVSRRVVKSSPVGVFDLIDALDQSEYEEIFTEVEENLAKLLRLNGWDLHLARTIFRGQKNH